MHSRASRRRTWCLGAKLDGVRSVAKPMLEVMPHGGRWTVRVDILVNDFEKITLEDVIALRGQ